VPTAEAERLFLASFIETRERFRTSLDDTRAGRLHLPNTDFDTGRATARGEYSLADSTYDELLDKLAARDFADMSDELGANLLAYYGAAARPPGTIAGADKRAAQTRLELSSLAAIRTSTIDR
jgi:hypothetical protein